MLREILNAPGSARDETIVLVSKASETPTISELAIKAEQVAQLVTKIAKRNRVLHQRGSEQEVVIRELRTHVADLEKRQEEARNRLEHLIQQMPSE